MARDLAPVVQGEQQVVLHEARVDAGKTLLQALVQLQLDPHAEEDGHRVADEPGHAQPEQHEADLLAEQNPEEDHEGGEDPDDQDSFVEDVVHCEPHVCRQLLHCAHVFLHRQL